MCRVRATLVGCRAEGSYFYSVIVSCGSPSCSVRGVPNTMRSYLMVVAILSIFLFSPSATCSRLLLILSIVILEGREKVTLHLSCMALKFTWKWTSTYKSKNTKSSHVMLVTSRLDERHITSRKVQEHKLYITSAARSRKEHHSTFTTQTWRDVWRRNFLA